MPHTPQFKRAVAPYTQRIERLEAERRSACDAIESKHSYAEIMLDGDLCRAMGIPDCEEERQEQRAHEAIVARTACGILAKQLKETQAVINSNRDLKRMYDHKCQKRRESQAAS